MSRWTNEFGITLSTEDEKGRWVTTEEGTHLFISDSDGTLKNKPGGKVIGKPSSGPAQKTSSSKNAKEKPPNKPTIEEYEEWLEKGWSYGDKGWEPPPEKQEVSSEITPEEHKKAAAIITDGAKKTIADAHNWEKTKPWELTEDEIRSGKHPSFVTGIKQHTSTETAHYEGDGIIALSPEYFGYQKRLGGESMRHVVYHELGHEMADNMTADGSVFRLVDAGVFPLKHEMGSSSTPEEFVADAYATLLTDPEWLKKKYPKAIKPLIDRARAMGMPVPDNIILSHSQHSSILDACLREANGDVEAAFAAAEYIAANLPTLGAALTTDAHGHEHRGKGPGGGQFVKGKSTRSDTGSHLGVHHKTKRILTFDNGQTMEVDGPGGTIEAERDKHKKQITILKAHVDEELRGTGLPRKMLAELSQTAIDENLPIRTTGVFSASGKTMMEKMVRDGLATALPNGDYELNREEIVKRYGGAGNKGLSISAFLAHDIANPRAQGILNRSLKAAKKLSADARADLAGAITASEKDGGRAIIAFIEKYREEMVRLLSVSQLAAILEGAREVASKIPRLDADAAAVGDIPQPTFPAEPSVHLPVIVEAARQLAEKNVLTRPDYDALDAAARAKAFTVAGVDAQETLGKIRDVMADNVAKGADYATFRQEVMDAVDAGTFLSDAHQETVFRTNVQTAFSDGQMTVLQNPIVQDGFPYATYDAIHDDRARHNHLAMEHHGIGGSNIYRIDDPVFQRFRPPWDYNDRCSWTPTTLEQAAEAGIEEAQRWLATGVPPADPAFVPMPPFAPPDGFERSLAGAPLSVRLSMQPLATFSHDVSGQKRDEDGKWTKSGAKPIQPEEPELKVAERLGLPTSYRGKQAHDPHRRKMHNLGTRDVVVDNPLQKASDQIRHRAGFLSQFADGVGNKVVSIDKIRASQDWIRPTVVEGYLNGTIEVDEDYEDEVGGLPIVMEVDGEIVIVNGNHRILASKMRGDGTVEVEYTIVTPEAMKEAEAFIKKHPGIELSTGGDSRDRFTIDLAHAALSISEINNPERASLASEVLVKLIAAEKNDAAFAVIGQRRYGSKSPGPGWVGPSRGRRGGHIWVYRGTHAGAAHTPVASTPAPAAQQPAPAPAPQPSPAPAPRPAALPPITPPTVGGKRPSNQAVADATVAYVSAKIAAGMQLDAADRATVARRLNMMNTAQLATLNTLLGGPNAAAAGSKANLLAAVQGLVGAAPAVSTPSPATPAPAPTPASNVVTAQTVAVGLPVVISGTAHPNAGMAGKILTFDQTTDRAYIDFGGLSAPPPVWVSYSDLTVISPAITNLTPAPPVSPTPAPSPQPAAKATPAGTVPRSTEKVVWNTGSETPVGAALAMDSLNGVDFAPAPPKFWEKTPDRDVGEPPPLTKIARVSILIQEPDGRVWIVTPTNGFGGRKYTMPGGTIEPGLTNQQNALKEVWEEMGIQAEITGYAGDFEDSNYAKSGSPRMGRLYIGKRIGGAPWQAKIEDHIIDQKTGKKSAESDTVVLVPPEEAAKLLHRTDDLAQLAVVNPIPLDTPTKGTGSQVLKNIVAAIKPAAAAHQERKKKANEYAGNSELYAVQNMRGFNGKPNVVDKKTFDDMMKKGEHVEMLRGLTGRHPLSADDLANQYRSGDNFPGHGIFGSGTYADSNKHGNVATSGGYAGYGNNGAILRIALPKTAKVIKVSELEKKVPEPPDDFKGYAGMYGKSRRECWLGVQAALAGYDAILADHSAHHGTYGKGFYVILNRSIVTVQDTNVSKNHVIK